MLVITRKIGQKIYIADRSICVTIVDVDRNKVRVGIDAPKDISVLREELVDTVWGPIVIGEGSQ